MRHLDEQRGLPHHRWSICWQMVPPLSCSRRCRPALADTGDVSRSTDVSCSSLTVSGGAGADSRRLVGVQIPPTALEAVLEGIRTLEATPPVPAPSAQPHRGHQHPGHQHAMQQLAMQQYAMPHQDAVHRVPESLLAAAAAVGPQSTLFTPEGFAAGRALPPPGQHSPPPVSRAKSSKDGALWAKKQRHSLQQTAPKQTPAVISID